MLCDVTVLCALAPPLRSLLQGLDYVLKLGKSYGRCVGGGLCTSHVVTQRVHTCTHVRTYTYTSRKVGGCAVTLSALHSTLFSSVLFVQVLIGVYPAIPFLLPGTPPALQHTSRPACTWELSPGFAAQPEPREARTRRAAGLVGLLSRAGGRVPPPRSPQRGPPSPILMHTSAPA